MKATIIRGTTVKGKAVNEGDTVELDAADFALLKAQGQARAYVDSDNQKKNK